MSIPPGYRLIAQAKYDELHAKGDALVSLEKKIEILLQQKTSAANAASAESAASAERAAKAERAANAERAASADMQKMKALIQQNEMLKKEKKSVPEGYALISKTKLDYMYSKLKTTPDFPKTEDAHLHKHLQTKIDQLMQENKSLKEKKLKNEVKQVSKFLRDRKEMHKRYFKLKEDYRIQDKYLTEDPVINKRWQKLESQRIIQMQDEG